MQFCAAVQREAEGRACARARAAPATVNGRLVFHETNPLAEILVTALDRVWEDPAGRNPSARIPANKAMRLSSDERVTFVHVSGEADTGHALFLFLMKNFSLAQRGIAAACALACASSFAQNANNATPELKPVVVSASRMEQVLQTAPVGASVILGEDIRASGVRDANEAVRLLGGVPSRGDLMGGREFSLDLRGYGESASQNLVVVIDGIRITENELAGARLSGISSEMIERIEIVRGGAGAIWGEGASGGVISVTTKGVKAGLSANMSLALESYAGRDAQASVEAGSNDGFGFYARLRDYRSDGFRDNSKQRQNSASLGITMNTGAFKLRMGLDRESNSSRFAGSLSIAQFQANPRQTLTPDDFGNMLLERVSAAMSYKLGGWTMALDLAQRERSTQSNFIGSGFDARGTSSQSQVSPRLSYAGDVGGVGLLALLGHDNINWTANYQNNFGQNEDATQSNRAWYGKLDALLPTQTRLSLAARREQVRKGAQDPSAFVPLAYSNQFSLPAWDLAVNQTIASGWDVYARTGKSFRVANVDESRFVNATLQPMTARDTELGLKYLQGSSSAALRIFRQSSTQEIAFDPINFVNVNQDDISRRGVELEGRTQIAQAWDISGNLQLMNARFSAGPNVGKRVPLVSRTSASVRLGYALTAQHRIEAALQHRSSAPIGGDVANTCTDQAPANTRLDMRYSWREKADGKGWRLAAAVDNVTDRKTYSYGFSAGCGFIGVYPDAGRVLRLTAGYTF
jgi:iron complex outermembrane recepter protein